MSKRRCDREVVELRNEHEAFSLMDLRGFEPDSVPRKRRVVVLAMVLETVLSAAEFVNRVDPALLDELLRKVYQFGCDFAELNCLTHPCSDSSSSHRREVLCDYHGDFLAVLRDVRDEDVANWDAASVRRIEVAHMGRIESAVVWRDVVVTLDSSFLRFWNADWSLRDSVVRKRPKGKFKWEIIDMLTVGEKLLILGVRYWDEMRMWMLEDVDANPLPFAYMENVSPGHNMLCYWEAAGLVAFAGLHGQMRETAVWLWQRESGAHFGTLNGGQLQVYTEQIVLCTWGDWLAFGAGGNPVEVYDVDLRKVLTLQASENSGLLTALAVFQGCLVSCTWTATGISLRFWDTLGQCLASRHISRPAIGGAIVPSPTLTVCGDRLVLKESVVKIWQC